MGKDKGVSLIELLLVVTAVGSLVFLVGNIPNSINLVGKAGRQSLAREIAAKQIEDKRAVQYVNLANGQSSISDARLSDLPFASGQVITSDCDPIVCTYGENAKKVTVSITWKESTETQTVTLETLIGEGGLNQ